MSRKKTVLLGLSIALIFLATAISGTSAQGYHLLTTTDSPLHCVLEGTVKDLGCDFYVAQGQTCNGEACSYTVWQVCTQRTHNDYWRFDFRTLRSQWHSIEDRQPWINEKVNTLPDGTEATWTSFHGHKAVWIISDNIYLSRPEIRPSLYWLIEPYQFKVSGKFSKGRGPGYNKSKQAVLEFAEVVYKNIIKCGIIESSELPDCLTATTLQNVNVIYPDGTEMMCKDPTTIELAEGMTFKPIDSNSKATIRLPDRIIHDLEEVKINTLQITNESFDIAYDAKMKPNGTSWSVEIPGAGTIGPALEDRHYLYPGEKIEQGTIGPVPKDILLLSDMFGVGLTGSRGELIATIVVEEVVEYAVIFVASTSMPFAAPAFIYDKLDKAGEITRGLTHLCQYMPDRPYTYYQPGPIHTQKAILTRFGQVVYESQGLIGITNNKTEVYVFEGEFQLTDLNGTKTVTILANQSSTCELGSVPTDPKPFNQSSVDRWWEIINKSTSFNDSQTENWTDDDSGCWEISNGVHTMTGTNNDKKIRCLFYSEELCNFTFQADMQKTSGDGLGYVCTYGLYFRGDGTKENYYIFTIAANGQCVIAKKVEGQYTEILGATRSDLLKSGHNEWNTLKITAEGLYIKFYINDEYITEMVDGSFPCGKLGLFAIDSPVSTTPDTVQFKNVQITELYETTPPHTPDIDILPPISHEAIHVIPIP